MTVRRWFVAVVVALVLLWPGSALADDPADTSAEMLHIESPFTVTTDGGSTVRLPPGYYMPEPTYDRLDLEVRRLQDAETRLMAENVVLRDTPPPTRRWWIGAAAGLIAGIVLGAYAF